MKQIELGDVNVALLKRYLNKTMAISKSQIVVFNLKEQTISAVATNSDMSIAKRWSVGCDQLSAGMLTADIFETDTVYLGFFDASVFVNKALRFEKINLTLNVDFDTDIQANVVKSLVIKTGDIRLNVSTSNVSILIKSVADYNRLHKLFDQDLSKNGKFEMTSDMLTRILQLSSLATSTNTKPFVAFSTRDGSLYATDETFDYRMLSDVTHEYSFSIMKRMLGVVCKESHEITIVSDQYAYFKSNSSQTECCVALAVKMSANDMEQYNAETTAFEDYVDVEALINA